jgi:hypothetical protein
MPADDFKAAVPEQIGDWKVREVLAALLRVRLVAAPWPGGRRLGTAEAAVRILSVG